MGDLESVHFKVKDVLENHPEARGSDDVLFMLVCKQMNPLVCGMPFETVMKHSKELGIPHYETVRRTRQKLQELREDLRPSEKVTDGRYKKWKEFREYATQQV